MCDYQSIINAIAEHFTKILFAFTFFSTLSVVIIGILIEEAITKNKN
jgi:hypothetical protein